MTNVAALLAQAATEHPDAVALTVAGSGESLTYAELARRVTRTAAALTAERVLPGDRVVVVDRNTLDHVVCWFGALHAGAVVIDLNFLLGAEQQEEILDDAGAKVVLCGHGVAGDTTMPPGTVRRSTALWQVDTRRGDCIDRVPGDPAVIAYTSGTTGRPKGVVHTHGSVIAQLDLLREACGFDRSWTSYVAIPLFSLHGFLPQVAALLSVGGRVVLDDKFDATRLATMSHRYPLSYTTLSSPMVPQLIGLPASERPDFTALRLLSCGGAPLHPDVRASFEDQFGIQLTQGYACTEVLGAFVMDLDGTAPHGAAGRVFPLGRPVAVVLDEGGAEVEPGVAGEIAFHRDYALHSYWNQPEASADAFVDGTWYATGDIGTIDADGFVSVLDRKKDVIFRGGFNIYSAEIERVLNEHRDVSEATVVAAPHPHLGEVPVAYVVLTDSGTTAVDELRAYAFGRLGRLKAPESIEVVGYDDLPRNGLGKVQKNVLRKSRTTALTPPSG